MPPVLTTPQEFSLWMVRVSFVLYAIAQVRLHRGIWTAACGLYLLHMVTAFAFFHNFSHREAYEATARQTQAMLGVYYGGGLYWNYVFTVVWMGDVMWAWLGGVRARWITWSVHGFLAFMFFNATVVFGKGWMRWVGAAGFLAVALVRIARRRSTVGR
ncbi:MAG: hypothetical protein JST93_22610 [Acidobacteria bacterium]|nr:hypothetical protein [Acidobacteriota bacterium]